MKGIFSRGSSLVDLSFLKEWNVSNVENMKDIFKDCNSIEKYSEQYEY